jgi:hypothetical protein
VQHDAPFVVVLVTEPAGDAFDLFDDAVVALGPGARDPKLEERLDLWPPPLDRAREPGRLGHVGVHAGRQEPGLLIPYGGSAVKSGRVDRRGDKARALSGMLEPSAHFGYLALNVKQRVLQTRRLSRLSLRFVPYIQLKLEPSCGLTAEGRTRDWIPTESDQEIRTDHR